jgi:hypothetical protein
MVSVLPNKVKILVLDFKLVIIKWLDTEKKNILMDGSKP